MRVSEMLTGARAIWRSRSSGLTPACWPISPAHPATLKGVPAPKC
jgi:hypothetical protein